MRDCDLYARILGIEAPWSVSKVELDEQRKLVNVCVEYRGPPICPSCGAFDKFHVAQHLSEAVDTVRQREHRELKAAGDQRRTRTKYFWLQNPDNMSEKRWSGFQELRRSSLRTARAWALKKHAMLLWAT